MVYGYCRVSTKHQNLKRQIDALIAYGIKEENIYVDEITGVVLKRRGLESLKNVLTTGDTLVVKEIDRLGRNRKQTTELIKEFIEKDIDIIALDIPYLKEFILKEIKREKGFMEIMATTLLSLILEVAEQERHKILDRTKEGKEKALEAGVKFGRKRKLTRQKFVRTYNQMIKDERSPKEIQEKLKICKQTYYNYKKRYIR
ncbi:recombinase family protein [Candidatus Cetobacterium colombiensis]|uniref:Recombinase family protein n=1 Tax=Candidatus Cetobacterium colombiensis TaxID=3073100 RepID=A0ABU4WBP4_9FUSO|nr:recombinase family protein [Candidatus Cetobacterium colombiensis]MDX8336575.1 recombinase family protein [Candidatus Cetobacterium colombiensis]